MNTTGSPLVIGRNSNIDNSLSFYRFLGAMLRLPFWPALVVALAPLAIESQTAPSAPRPVVWSRDPKADSAFIATYAVPGMPAGFRVRIDAQAKYDERLRYRRSADAFLIESGPGHIFYAPDDTASGSFSVSTTVAQQARSQAKDAYGLFFGGRALGASRHAYSYFLIREGGEFLIKIRDADSMRVLVDWTRHPAVPFDTVRGAITASLAVRAAPDSTRFLVNGQQVTALPAGAVPTAGIAGVRVNKGLKVRITPARISR